MSSLQIGKSVYQILNDIQPKKVFPLIADQGVEYPFIIYRRSALSPASTKDRYNYQELATVEVIVADSTYAGSIELAEKVKLKMEKTRGEIAGIKIGEVQLVSSNESFLEDAFLQNLTFYITIL